jgi:superfamily II DNA or RNA helicase
MHPKLAAATTLPKLSTAASALGLESELSLSIDELLARAANNTFARPLIASLARRFEMRTIRDLLDNQDAQRWLQKNAAVESEELVDLIRQTLASLPLEARSKKHRRPEEAPWPKSEPELFAWAEKANIPEQLEAPLSLALEGQENKRVRAAATGARGRQHLREMLVPSLSLDNMAEDVVLLEEEFDAEEIDAIKSAVWSYLTASAAETARALAEEETWLGAQVPPERKGTRRLYDALFAARTEARRYAKPREKARLVEQRLNAVEHDRGRVTYNYQETGARELGRSGVLYSTVLIDLDPYEELVVHARCTCTPRFHNRCTHAIAAIELAIERLADPQPAIAKLIALLEKPRWSGTIEAIDAAISRGREKIARGEDYRLWWQIEPSLNGLELLPWLQKRGKKGELGKPKPVSFERLSEEPEMLSLPADRRVLDMISPPWLRLTPHQRAMLLSRSFPRVLRAISMLVHHPRVFYGNDPEQTISVRGGRLELFLEEEPGGELRLSPRLDGEMLEMSTLLALINDPAATDIVHRLDLRAQTFTLLALDGEQRALLHALARHTFSFPADSKSELIRRLPELGRVLTLVLPESFSGRRVAPASRLVFRMEPIEASLRVDALVRPLPNGPSFPPAEGAIDVLGIEGSELVATKRDLEREIAVARRWFSVLELTPNEEDPRYTWIIDDLERALAFCGRLREHATEIDVEWPKSEPWRVTRRATTQDLRVELEDKKSWFTISGGVQVDGEKVELKELLEAARKKKSFVRVAGGKWVAIADELRAHLGTLDDAIAKTDGELHLGASGMLALEQLADHIGELDAPERFKELRERIAEANSYDPPPPNLALALRDYQLAGYRWLARLAHWNAGACLADDMGLGKTIQTLAVLELRKNEGPSLVVAPTSVCFNWIREAQAAAPQLTPLLYRELDRAKALDELRAGDVLVVSYGLLARDITRFEQVSFGTLVIDEAQAIKNSTTRRARAVRNLDAKWRVALTGTPIENHLGELWSLFRAISPGLFGGFDSFRDRFASPIERDKDPTRRLALATIIRPFVLRRTKSEVAKELPPRTDIRVEIELSADERRLYEAVRAAALEDLAKKGDGDEAFEEKRFRVLAALTRLRQLACHPRLYEDSSPIPSSKLARFMELVDGLKKEGHRALVFSQFTRHLGLVRRALDQAGVAYLYLDGSTPSSERARIVDAFQRGEAELFLISLKAGGTGLNLTAADYVMHLDPWWNPAVEDQATDRAHRIGQARPVTVYRLVARRTIEEAMLALHTEKRKLVADLLEGADTAAKVSTEELVRLIREGAGERDVEEPDAAADLEATEEDGAPISRINSSR